MTTVHVGHTIADDERRQALYQGDLVVLPPTPASLALVALAQDMIEDAFAPYQPRLAQFSMEVEEWVARFAPVKPAFIHHERTAELIPQILRETGCSPADTYFDVPRLRGVTSDGYLTSGVGYAHHPHRDTWFSAPLAQLNWWMPIYPCATDNVMAFHPHYFDAGIANSSSDFNYYRWNADGRRNAAQHIRSDTRSQPTAADPLVLEPELRVVCDVGSLLVFSAAHLHSTVPNTSGLTRFSLDFRTVSLADLRTGGGAVNQDSAPEGTSLRDFRQVGDRQPVPAEVVEQFDAGAQQDGALVFRPEPVRETLPATPSLVPASGPDPNRIHHQA